MWVSNLVSNRNEHKLKVSENRVPRKMVWPQTEEVTAEW